MKRITWQIGLIYLALMVSVAAAVKERRSLNRAMDRMSGHRETILHLDLYKKALIAHLSEADLGSPFLKGRNAGGSESGGDLSVESSDAVLYLLSTECPISPANYGFLNELVDSGVPVFGLAFDDTEEAVERHRSEWETRFPILVSPEGSAIGVVPRYATPTIVVVSQGEVVWLDFGELLPEAQDVLKAALRDPVNGVSPAQG